jgi:hypothetical protein
VTCSGPIYIPGEFQSIWRPPSSGPNYLGLQSSSGAHHSVEEFRSTGFESGFGDLDIWVVFTVTRSISWHIFRVIGHLWQQGRIIEGFSILAERGTFQLGGLASLRPRSIVFIFIVYLAFGGMLEFPIGAFCSSSIVYLLGHLLSFPDRHLHCSRFLYLMNKSYLRCFGLSIILHMVEVCSMVVSSCYLLHTHI